MNAVNPYLNFSGNTKEAFNFYESVFGGKFVGVVRFKDFEENDMGVTGEDLNKIANIALPLGKATFLMGDDGPAVMGESVTVGNNFYINLGTESAEEAERLFNNLSNGGKVQMLFQETEWAEKFSMCSDKFGVQWMVNYTGEKGS